MFVSKLAPTKYSQLLRKASGPPKTASGLAAVKLATFAANRLLFVPLRLVSLGQWVVRVLDDIYRRHLR